MDEEELAGMMVAPVRSVGATERSADDSLELDVIGLIDDAHGPLPVLNPTLAEIDLRGVQSTHR